MAGCPEDAARSLDAALAGSLDALGETLEGCRFYLLAVAERDLDLDLRAKGGASDLVQETFLEAQRDFAQFGGKTPDELLIWLRRLLKNNMANFLRHYRGTAKRRSAREVQPGGDASAGGLAARVADGARAPARS